MYVPEDAPEITPANLALELGMPPDSDPDSVVEECRRRLAGELGLPPTAKKKDIIEHRGLSKLRLDHGPQVNGLLLAWNIADQLSGGKLA